MKEIFVSFIIQLLILSSKLIEQLYAEYFLIATMLSI